MIPWAGYIPRKPIAPVVVRTRLVPVGKVKRRRRRRSHSTGFINGVVFGIVGLAMAIERDRQRRAQQWFKR